LFLHFKWFLFLIYINNLSTLTPKNTIIYIHFDYKIYKCRVQFLMKALQILICNLSFSPSPQY
jgi:hypothetical protein